MSCRIAISRQIDRVDVMAYIARTKLHVVRRAFDFISCRIMD